MKQVELMDDGTLVVRTKHFPDVHRVLVQPGVGKECTIFYADGVEVGKCEDCGKKRVIRPGMTVCTFTGAVVQKGGYCDHFEIR